MEVLVTLTRAILVELEREIILLIMLSVNKGRDLGIKWRKTRGREVCYLS